jgi:hypothetical protein
MERQHRMTATRASAWEDARCLFRHGGLKGATRLVLLRAGSDKEAITLAEHEARKYARRDPGITYLHYVETYHLFAASIRSGAEVFSLLRSSNRSAARFLSRYYDDGSEHRRNWTRSRRTERCT